MRAGFRLARRAFRVRVMKVYREEEYLNPKENINIYMSCLKGLEPVHMHEFAEIVYIYRGSAKQMVGENVYDVSEGDMLFIDVGQTHAFSCDDTFDYVNILLKPEFMSSELINSSNIFEVLSLAAFDEEKKSVPENIRKVSFRGSSLILVKHIIDMMLEEFEKKQMGYRSAIKGYMNILFAHSLREMQKKTAAGELLYVGKIEPEILEYIEKNITEKLTLGDLAARSFYTPSYFCRVFKQCFGMSFKSYIKKKRIEKALYYLCNSKSSLDKIMDMVGYSDRALFFKHFKEITSKTPSEMRKESQKNLQ